MELQIYSTVPSISGFWLQNIMLCYCKLNPTCSKISWNTSMLHQLAWLYFCIHRAKSFKPIPFRNPHFREEIRCKDQACAVRLRLLEKSVITEGPAYLLRVGRHG